MKKILFILTLVICALFFGVPNNSATCFAVNKPTQDLIIIDKEDVVQVSNSVDFPLFDRIFGKKENNEGKSINDVSKSEDMRVIVGGIPLGFTIYTHGVIVVGISEVETNVGKVNTIVNGDVEPGDVLLTLNNVEVNSADDISNYLRTYTGEGQIVAKIKRGEIFKNIDIAPAIDSLTGEYKLGLWIRDNSAGVGTLTYVKTNGRFGALGHSVCDIDTGVIMPIEKGNVYKCNVVGVEKSKAGKPGELRGLFLKNGTPIGTLKSNTNVGVYGKIEDKKTINALGGEVEVANANEVKMGAAVLRTTIDGSKATDYNIEIVKTSYINHSGQNSFVIKITDDRLLNATGGIVQGMSGSPILQNGKLIGAVTHVFVNDASRGFAIHIGEMIKDDNLS